MPESAALIGATLGSHCTPQELVDELGVIVWRSAMSPRLWAAWSPSTSTLLVTKGLSREHEDYALVLGAAHMLRGQLMEPQDLYLYGVDFEPMYASSIHEEVIALVDAYFAARLVVLVPPRAHVELS